MARVRFLMVDGGVQQYAQVRSISFIHYNGEFQESINARRAAVVRGRVVAAPAMVPLMRVRVDNAAHPAHGFTITRFDVRLAFVC